jgi:uncharacterized protein (TIGR02147 family)
MSDLSLYSHESYRDFLKAKIRTVKEKWGLMTKLAAAAGCQRPYLSRVLKGDAHLTSAQAFGLTRFWNLTDDETAYFLGLLEMEKAGSAAYREYWRSKNLENKNAHENLHRVVHRRAAGTDERDLTYYSSWHWTAIHILVSIPEFQTERAIAERLGLPLRLVQSTLRELEAWGGVRRDGGRWKFYSCEQHITKDSPLAAFHHSNWRGRAASSAQERNPESVHYTVVQSLSRTDFQKIRTQVLELIQSAAAIAGPSKEEKLMCFACDFFEP